MPIGWWTLMTRGWRTPALRAIAARRQVLSAARPCLLLLALTACSTHGSSFLAPHGPVAAAQRRWFLEALALMAIVVVPALVLAPFFAWRYRYGGSRAAYRPNWSFSWPLEILIWGVPLAIVGALSWFVFIPEIKFDPYNRLPVAGGTLRVEVVALNWKWLFIYPEQGIASIGTMAIPVGRNVEFDLTSDRTMQSFLIPALGSQIYAMAGMVTRLNLAASAPGDYMGENTQFNGMGFQRDRFSTQAMTPAEFAGWVSKVKSSPLKLDQPVYDVLHRDSTAEQARQMLHATASPADALYFSSVPRDFFKSIVARYRGAQMPPPA